MIKAQCQTLSLSSSVAVREVGCIDQREFAQNLRCSFVKILDEILRNVQLAIESATCPHRRNEADSRLSYQKVTAIAARRNPAPALPAPR